MAETFLVPSPDDIGWDTWASAVIVSAASAYTLPNPGDEGSWQAWATELLTVTNLIGEGSVDPRLYGQDWRRWAAAFMLVTA